MTERACDGCTLCCTLLGVRELDKPSGRQCQHQTVTGCGIWGRPERPKCCRMWRCRWLRGDPTGERPDRAGYVVDDLPVAPLIQVWVTRERPHSWINADLLKYMHSKMATNALVVRTSETEARQITNGEVLCWLEHYGYIDDASWPYLKDQGHG